MTTLRVCVPTLGLLAAALIAPARAQQPPPRTIAFTGYLADTPGHAKPDGSYGVTLALYTTATGGAPGWSESKNVVVARGLFSTALGDTAPLPSSLDFSQALFVGVRVAGGAEMTPRLALQSVPYALFARSVARDPAQLANVSGNALSTDGTDVAAHGDLSVAGDLRFGQEGEWSALASSVPRQMIAGQVKGATGEAIGSGFTCEKSLPGIYYITAPPDPRTSLLIATPVGQANWSICVSPAEDNKTHVWRYRVETRNGGFLNDPTAFNFLILSDRPS